MGRLWQEGTDALRSLRRAPGHAATCVSLLAVGIASGAAVLSVHDALLRRPLPVVDGERLIVPYGSRGDDKRLLASAVEAEAWRRADSFQGFAVARPQAVTLDLDGRPERLRAARVEAGYLPLLGVRPLLGRVFDASEIRSGARVAVISFGLWHRRFGGDPAVLDRALRIEADEWEVVGVMPRGFDLPLGSELWQPLDLDAVPAERRGNRIYDPVARLARGRSLDDARSELALIARRLEEERPDTNAGWGVRAITLRRHLLDDPQGALDRAIDLTSWGASFLLLIACANVAQLQILRAAGRQAELGTRLALGGSLASVSRLLLFEALVLSALSGGLALPLTWALAEALMRLSPVTPTAFSGHILAVAHGPQVVASVVLAALATALASAVYPALLAARTDAARLLSGAARSSPDRGRRAFLEGAVLAQVAVTVTLLCATATLGESYAALRRLDLGFRTDGLSYYELSLAPSEYADRDRRAAFAEALAGAVAESEGSTLASFTTNVPLSVPTVNWVAGHGCEGREMAPGEELMTADRLVAPGYLETLGLRLLAGRTITDRDTEATEPVAVVNQTLADECWPGEDVLGKRVLRARRDGWLAMRVVGVVADAQEQRVSFGAPHAAWYLPYRQHDYLRDLYLVVRGDVSPALVREQVRRLDAHQPLAGPRSLTEHVEEVTGSDRVAALVMAYFAALALLLVAIGIHGSMQRFVSQQHRAIGIRMALGAGPRRVVAGVVGRGLALAVLGAALGAWGAVALQRPVAAFVHEVFLDAPSRLSVTVLVVLATAAAACAAPAHRAGRIDPARLLRE